MIAANTEMGGNGASTDGTNIGNEVKIAATNDPKYAYEMGRVSGVKLLPSDAIGVLLQSLTFYATGVIQSSQLVLGVQMWIKRLNYL